MPVLHRRNVPNCRPMVDGGMRKCSAGACPPLGSGWGVAESVVPIRFSVRKDSDPGCTLQSTSMPVLHRRNVPNCFDGGMRKCSAGGPPWGRGGAWQNPPCQFAVPSHNSGFSYLGVPASMSDCYERMSRTTIRDRLPPLNSSFQRSKARPVPRFGAGIQKGWGWVRPPDGGKNRPVTPFS